MFPSAPRILFWLVAAVVLLRLLVAVLLPGPVVFPLLQAAFLAFIGWKALSGSLNAAFFLAGLLVLGVTVSAIRLASEPDLPVEVLAISTAWAALHLGTAGVNFFHSGVKKFYAARANAGWRGVL